MFLPGLLKKGTSVGSFKREYIGLNRKGGSYSRLDYYYVCRAGGTRESESQIREQMSFPEIS